MLSNIEKLIKRNNKNKMKKTLGVVVSFLLSIDSFAVEGIDKKNIDDFSELKKIFELEKKIEKKLSDGSDINITLDDNWVLITQNINKNKDQKSNIEVFKINLKDLKKLENFNEIYGNLIKALEKLKETAGILKVDIFQDEINENFNFGMQSIKENKIGINNGVIVNRNRGQIVAGLGINNGAIISGFGQSICDSGLGVNNGIINGNLQGQYVSVGMAINNGIINSENSAQFLEFGLGINNSIINNNGYGQNIISLSTGINNNKIISTKRSGIGQSIDGSSIGINNGLIDKYIGQSVEIAVALNTGEIMAKARGQFSKDGIGINTGKIKTYTGIEGMASVGQNISNIGFNYGIIESKDGIAQHISESGALNINNGVLEGYQGQVINTLGKVINNGIIISEFGYSSVNKTGGFYKNGIVLKRDINGKLILNEGKIQDKKYNDNIRIYDKSSLNEIENKFSKTSKTVNKNHNIFINNLANDIKNEDNHLIVDYNLTSNSYLGRDYSDTHITTAVAKDSNIKEGIIKIENNNDNFVMNNSTIIGYFEKDGILVDMSKNKKIELNNSVISAVGEDEILETSIKVNAGTEINLNNSIINGKLLFDNLENSIETENTMILKSKYYGENKDIYEKGNQFFTSVNNVEFRGNTNDNINIFIEKNISDKSNMTGKGFISIGNIDFKEGKDSLKLNFEDYKSGHLNITGVIDFGEDKEEDEVKFTSKISMNDESWIDLQILNNFLNQMKNLDILQLANEENKVILGKDGISLNFCGIIRGGNSNDIFKISGNKTQIYNIDGGEGENKLIIGRNEGRLEKGLLNNYITINGTISNFKEVDINTNLKLREDTIFTNVSNNNLDLKGNNLILEINKNKRDEKENIIGNALYNNNQDIVFNNTDSIILDIVDIDKTENIIIKNKDMENNKDNYKFKSNTSIHNVKVEKNGNLKINISENIPVEPILPPKPENPSTNPNIIYEIVPNYNYLNKIYKSIVSSGIDSMRKTIQLNEDLDNGIIKKTEKESIIAQLEFYGKIFNTTPYSYSNEISKKSIHLIVDEIFENNRILEKEEWQFGGKILGKGLDDKNNFYGRNYYGVDNIKSQININSDILGSYAYGEYGLTENKILGITLGGIKSSTKISDSNLKGNSIFVLGYMKKNIEKIKLKLGIGYQRSFYDSDRVVKNRYQSMTTKKNYFDDTFTAFAEARYCFSLGKNIYFEPYEKVIGTYTKQGNIHENNSNKLNIDVEKKDFLSFDSEFGAELVKKIYIFQNKIELKAGTSIVYALKGYENKYLVGEIKGSNKKFEIIDSKDDRTKIKFNLQGSYELNNGISYNIDGNYITSSHSKEYSIGIGIGYKF